jgi:hypothetical protein
VKTLKSLKDFELDNLLPDRRSSAQYNPHHHASDSLLPANEEIKICENLITLLVDNQLMTPTLNAAGNWYRKFLRNNVAYFWPLIRKALNDVNCCASTPSQKDFAVVVCFIYEVAKELIVHKDVALTDIVDSLVNAKFFKPDLEQDYDRIVPNQLVFAVIGWLRKLHNLQAHL